MDTCKASFKEVRTRRRWAIEEKRRIAEETFQPGTSVSRTAQSYALNANQVFLWRKLYREGRLGKAATTKLLPVSIADERMVGAVKVAGPVPGLLLGTMEIKLAKGSLQLTGQVDLAALRTALECLVG